VAEQSVELDDLGMRIQFICGCRIVLKAEDGRKMLGVIPNGSMFVCVHGHGLTFTGTGQWAFRLPYGTVHTLN